MSIIQHIFKDGDSNCAYNRNIFDKLKKDFPELQIEEIKFDSEKGKKIIEQHNIRVFPATIVNGAYFTSGGVEESELRKIL